MTDAPRPVTVALPTLGCKVNRYDSDALARALVARGYVIVPPGEAADVYIVNTCTVTREAEAKSRKTLRKALRINPDATLIVTGCYATLEARTLVTLDGVDAVVPITEQAGIPEMVARLRPALTPGPSPRGEGSTCQASTHLPPSPRGEGPGVRAASIDRTRATVKVQDGCDLRCAFCAVTLARGPVRSRRPEEVVTELRPLLDAGIREVVLTGVRLDAYGKDLGLSLADLLDAARDLPIARLRLSSLEPIGLNDRLLAALADHPSLCPHFHICLQSGDDGVLRAMRRGYSVDDYRRLVTRLSADRPDATFTTDVIVGFPGETDAAFHNTCDLVRAIGFLKLHIFKFSPRHGTHAATLPDQISDGVKDARSRTLFAIERDLFRAYAEAQVGKTVPVLVERTGPHGDGLTPHYLRVSAAFPKAAANTIVPVRVTGVGEDGVVGVMLPVKS